MNRPSHKELFGKLRSARQAVSEEQVALLNQLSLAADAIELEYILELELKSVLCCNGSDSFDVCGGFELALKNGVGLDLFYEGV